ncbi:hypothetical protein ACFFX0_24010 [Citricoccus parietis]|uniref:Uncharacterized protein n=1 Tax=Citricoccus parietis TaxID=592307 RepID=A0ABV5G557_9MICC
MRRAFIIQLDSEFFGGGSRSDVARDQGESHQGRQSVHELGSLHGVGRSHGHNQHGLFGILNQDRTGHHVKDVPKHRPITVDDRSGRHFEGVFVHYRRFPFLLESPFRGISTPSRLSIAIAFLSDR